MLVTSSEMLNKAITGGYAVGAFNTSNLEITKAIIEAAEELEAPVILAVSPKGIAYAGLEYIYAIAKVAASGKTPAAIHLDHGKTFEDCRDAIEIGFSSVMIDGSSLPFGENVELTKRVVEFARPKGVSVEGEIGPLVKADEIVESENWDLSLTQPDQASEFAVWSGVDSLAISIGNVHGWYRGEPHLDFERLEKIRTIVEVPLVLHGASGIPAGDIKKAISVGVQKINIDTEIRASFTEAVASFLKEYPDSIDPRSYLSPAMDSVKEVVKGKIELFGSVGNGI